MDDGFGILSVNICISVSSCMENRMMIRVLGILVVVGVLVGCGEEIKIHTEKYDNGKVKIKGNLVDGKQEGKWVRYY